MSKYSIDHVLDASGLNCPMPLLKAKQALNGLEKGQILKVIATDGGSVRDFKAYTDLVAHDLIDMHTESSPYIYIIRRN